MPAMNKDLAYYEGYLAALREILAITDNAHDSRLIDVLLNKISMATDESIILRNELIASIDKTLDKMETGQG